MHQDMKWMNNRRSAAEQAKRDIIRAIFKSDAVSEIRYFDYEKGGAGAAAISNEIEFMIQQSVPDTEKQVELSNLVTDYSYDEELRGFREWFSIAAGKFMQGISGRSTM